MSVRILIADDHEVIRQGIRMILQARPEWEICGEATNGHDTIRLVKELKPDVSIVDITMPGLSGLEATQLKSRAIQILRFSSSRCTNPPALRTQSAESVPAGMYLSRRQAAN